MASIRKIALTPVKWVSRKIIHHTLLRFPGDGKAGALACTYCPEMCRFSCSSAVVSGNDAVTPSNKMGLLYREEKWPDLQAKTTSGSPSWPIYDCTGCGRCSEYCVYQVPVAETLFAARSTHPDPRALEISKKLTPEVDPWGEYLEELGQVEWAKQRVREATQALGFSVVEVNEPKTVHYLGYQGISAALSWQSLLMMELGDTGWENLRQKLHGRRWLLAESSWLNRRLGRTEQVRLWSQRAIESGINLVIPFQNGKDCIDTGGEGAYSLMFPQQAAQMARDFWTRDCERADGILCMSSRIATHLSQSLNSETVAKRPELILSLSEMGARQ